MDTRCEEACQILERTDDGNTLAPEELSLLQGAVNDVLNEYGEKIWKELHTAVMKETFIPFKDRWFRGIVDITADLAGAGGGLWILYKGKQIEHYDMPWAYTEEALTSLIELKKRCVTVEESGQEINTTNVIWKWDNEKKI